MSQTVVPSTVEERRRAAARLGAPAEGHEPKQLDALHTETGDTTIADTVVVKIAGLAAREVHGVHALGNAARRAIGSLAQRIPGSTQPSVSGGVSVEKGEREAAIDISVVVEHGVPVVTVSEQIRQSVISAVEHGTGLEVVSVDVNVSDVHLPDEDDDAGSSGHDALR